MKRYSVSDSSWRYGSRNSKRNPLKSTHWNLKWATYKSGGSGGPSGGPTIERHGPVMGLAQGNRAMQVQVLPLVPNTLRGGSSW